MHAEEKEIKIKISQEEFTSLQKLVSQKATNKKILVQKDIYFDTENFYITNLNRGLRARFISGIETTLEFKSLFACTYAKNENPWFIEEISMPFPLANNSINKLKSILNRLELSHSEFTFGKTYNYQKLESSLSKSGIVPKINVAKKRIEYSIGASILAFDYIKDLGYFLEVESTKEDPAQVLKHIGVVNFEVIRNGYNDMMAEPSPNYVSNEDKQKKFRKNPKWNVLPKEKDLVNKLLQE